MGTVRSAANNINGKTIVITGAARGIGFATAEALLRQGARVIIGDRDVALGESAIAKLSASGPVSGHPLDVADYESFATFLDKARADGGGHIDVLINNAGVMPVGPFLDHTDQAVRSAVEVNLYGVVNGCRLALPEMVRRGAGQIINIASVAGLLAVPGQALYAATKFAVVGLSSALADEFASKGVHISCVMPTFTNTELISGTQPGAMTKPVEPEAVAAAVAKSLHSRRTAASVPYGLRYLAGAMALLPPRARRRLSAAMGADRVFIDFDTATRAAYEMRAQAATGVIDPSAPG